MRSHILSDLHLEFGAVDIPDPGSDVPVFAGDVAVGPKGVDWIRHRFADRPIVYVLGNHEFYHHNLPALTQSLKRETRGSLIHVLKNSSVELGGFTFLGGALWTDFELRHTAKFDMSQAADLIADYRIIHFGPNDRPLRPRDTVDAHAGSVAWLKSELSRHDPARTIVVTHHAPSPLSEAPRYTNGPLSPAFVSDHTEFVKSSGIPLWIHGAYAFQRRLSTWDHSCPD